MAYNRKNNYARKLFTKNVFFFSLIRYNIESDTISTYGGLSIVGNIAFNDY